MRSFPKQTVTIVLGQSCWQLVSSWFSFWVSLSANLFICLLAWLMAESDIIAMIYLRTNCSCLSLFCGIIKRASFKARFGTKFSTYQRCGKIDLKISCYDLKQKTVHQTISRLCCLIVSLCLARQVDQVESADCTCSQSTQIITETHQLSLMNSNWF